MKLYVNRKPINGPWGGGNRFVAAMYDLVESSSDFELLNPIVETARPDIVLLVGINGENGCISAEQAIVYKMFHRPQMKIVLRVNENDARKATSGVDEALIRISEHIDATVFVSKWLEDYFIEKGWKCKNNIVIHNGVDQEIFKPGEKINNGKVNIVTHHWSNNFMKGFDIYDKLDEFAHLNDKYTFTYIGRERGTFTGRNSKVIEPLSGQKLADELCKYDVYISASRFDPGPNHISESISCGLPTYVYKDGGGCCEFAGQSHVYNSWEELVELLESVKFEQNKTGFTDWETCVEKYVEFLVETCKE